MRPKVMSGLPTASTQAIRRLFVNSHICSPNVLFHCGKLKKRMPVFFPF